MQINAYLLNALKLQVYVEQPAVHVGVVCCCLAQVDRHV
jgi:hypothetical protein